MTIDLLIGACNAIAEAVSMLPPVESGKVLRRGAGGDLTKMIDLVGEEAAIAYLEHSHFSGTLISEELGRRQFGSNSSPILVLDPIDGTTNAVRGINFCSISIAIANGPKLSDVYAGAVMELPTRRTFTGERGKGAYLDGIKIATPVPPALGESLIGVDLNFQGNIEKLAEILPLVLGAKHIRNMGSAALELCLVASGGLDLYADNRGLLRVTDIAASCIILKEAGALVLDIHGNPLNSNLDLSERISLVAGAAVICDEALAKIGRK
jgi:myo-inositol-1(or 4)-monophosphatase